MITTIVPPDNMTPKLRRSHQADSGVVVMSGHFPEKMPAGGGLGNDAGIASAHSKNLHSVMPRRIGAFKDLAHAQSLLTGNDVRATKGGKHRTRQCHRCRQFNKDCVAILLSPDASQSAASLNNLQTCGSVWACPVCAPRIASERGKEIQQALDWAGENGLIPVMLTLTARHDGEMSLQHIKSGFKAAWRYFSAGRPWQRFRENFGIEHTITAREVLYSWASGNGWHYHMHTLMFIRRDVMRDAIETDIENELRPRWLKALARQGLDAIGEFGLNVSAHGDVPGKYLSKLGLNPEQAGKDTRYELSGAGNKQGRSGVNVWTLLHRSTRRDASGNPAAGAKLAEKCYLEYVVTMQGENWITWSHGFKGLVGVDDRTDDEISKEDDPVEMLPWMKLSQEQWQPVARSRDYAGLLLVAAETRSQEAVLTFIDELRDAALSHYRPEDTGAAGMSHFQSGQRSQVKVALSRLGRLRSNRQFVLKLIRWHELKMRQSAALDGQIEAELNRLKKLRGELSEHNRLISDTESDLAPLMGDFL